MFYSHYFLMSLSVLILSLFLFQVLSVSVIQWKKSLNIIVLLEIGVIVIISLFYAKSNNGSLLMGLFVFFVSEALVMMSALFASLQMVGLVYGSLTFL